jgi:hypothetical protein
LTAVPAHALVFEPEQPPGMVCTLARADRGDRYIAI